VTCAGCDLARSSLVTAAAISALARLLPALQPADWTNREGCVNFLYSTLLDCCSSSTGGAAALPAAAEALGYAGVVVLQHQDDRRLFGSSSSGGSSSGADRGLCLGYSCLGLLLSVLLSLETSQVSADLAAAVQQVQQQLPGSFQELLLLQEISLGKVSLNIKLNGSHEPLGQPKPCCCMAMTVEQNLLVCLLPVKLSYCHVVMVNQESAVSTVPWRMWLLAAGRWAPGGYCCCC